MKLVFMGTPDFSVPALGALIEAGHEILAVYSQPPRPAGRGQKERPSPVHAFAQEQGLDVRTPVSFRDESVIAEFAALEADAAVVVAYGLILPVSALEAPRLGCLNIHASLLPRWRGAAPIQRAIEAGDSESGVCIMQMEQGLDTGPVLLERRCPITAETTASSLHDALSELGGAAVVDALEQLGRGEIRAVTQAEEGITYAHKLEKAEGLLDWRQTAAELDRKQRALTPWPGVQFLHKGQRIKVLKVRVLDEAPQAEAGTVLDLPGVPLAVACGSGALVLETLQRPGKGPMEIAAFVNGYAFERGEMLPLPEDA
ncbi:methionyl-tRNA formyltransferase [Kiloniella sp. b19]|uniref:methionyl-tRNA formyltransferase n=1 Tax=Kiloniella sp. GXU_MW_B19 TaxID=3141326 RepID=UPI0031DBA083